MTAMSGSPESVAESALAALGQGTEEDALTAIDQALAKNPDLPLLWHVKALLHRELEDMEPALAAFARAAKLAPGNPKIAHGIALTRLEAGLESIPDFVSAIQLAPDNLELFTGLASALVAEGQPAVAIEGLERTLAVRPDWIAGLAAVTHLRWESGDRATFTKGYEQARAQLPQIAALWRDELFALMHAERFDAALALVERGRAAIGDSSLFQAIEAAAYSETGQFARADPLFDALSDSPEGWIQLRRVRHLLASARPAEAAMLAAHWVKSAEPDHFWPYLSLAWRLTGDSRWQWLEGDERFVGVYDIADRLPDLTLLGERLRMLHRSVGQPLTHSLRGGSQTHGNLFAHIDPVIRHLRRAIADTVAEHAEQLPAPVPDHPLLAARRSPIRFAGSWSVRLSGGGSHANHVHPKGWLSSALYVSLPDELSGDDDARAGWLTLGEPQEELKLDIAPFRYVEPRPGRLVLFPSTMWHGTVPFAVGERLTVAFDVARLPGG